MSVLHSGKSYFISVGPAAWIAASQCDELLAIDSSKAVLPGLRWESPCSPLFVAESEEDEMPKTQKGEKASRTHPENAQQKSFRLSCTNTVLQSRACRDEESHGHYTAHLDAHEEDQPALGHARGLGPLEICEAEVLQVQIVVGRGRHIQSQPV